MEFATERPIDVICIGNALMDLLVEVDDDFLARHGLTKGSMHLVEEDAARRYLAELSKAHIRTEAGGAAANVARGVQFLGGTAAFCGVVGEDIYGGMYVDSLTELGVQPQVGLDALHTGMAVTYITPDHERTFTVYLGAALMLRADQINEESIAAAKVLHIEGYLLEGPTAEAVHHAILLAKKHGTKISIDLADAGLIERQFQVLHNIVSEDADIVFANETEGQAFADADHEKVLHELSSRAEMAVLKLGKEGSRIAANGEVTHVDAVTVEAVDTTGAGDMYAAGMLYGVTHAQAIADAGALGSAFAAKIVTQIGVGLDEMENPLNQR